MFFKRIRIIHAKLNIVPFCSTTSSPRSISIAKQSYYDTTVRATPEQPQVNSTANEYKTECQETDNKRPQQLT